MKVEITLELFTDPEHEAEIELDRALKLVSDTNQSSDVSLYLVTHEEKRLIYTNSLDNWIRILNMHLHRQREPWYADIDCPIVPFTLTQVSVFCRFNFEDLSMTVNQKEFETALWLFGGRRF